jgi:hypothetical protein
VLQALQGAQGGVQEQEGRLAGCRRHPGKARACQKAGLRVCSRASSSASWAWCCGGGAAAQWPQKGSELEDGAWLE